jgi:large subunit ribosomal protein L6
MSRIGKLPIPIDAKVKVAINASEVSVQGPKGSIQHTLPAGISAELEGQVMTLRRRDDTKAQKALHGLARSLLANAVHGVNVGFTKQLEIHGVGYAAVVQGSKVNFKLGYSHPIVYDIPEGVSIKVERNVVTVSGHDRQQVGQVSAEIRDLRRPDVYKQKGIRYSGEQLRKKAGKAGAK